MRPLPTTLYVYAEWKRVRAAFDYHVDVDRHYYSVPHALVGQDLWARYSAAKTWAVCEHLLQRKSHPEQGYRACLGLLALARQYGQGRLEAASTLAVKLQSPTRKSVLSILKTGRDRRQPVTPEPLDLPEHT